MAWDDTATACGTGHIRDCLIGQAEGASESGTAPVAAEEYHGYVAVDNRDRR